MERKYPFSEVRFIWMNGELVEFADAKVHVLSHALHYASAVFEGLRAYATPNGPALFRFDEHLDRLIDSARIYRMAIPFSREELADAMHLTLDANELEGCYVRPLVYRGFGWLRVNPTPCPVEVAIAAWPAPGRLLGAEAIENGVDIRVSSWRRPGPGVLPANAKASGNYLGGQLIALEAIASGCPIGIALDSQGNVSEGSTENVFLVSGDRITTPPMGASILAGITRDAVMTIAREMGLEVEEAAIPRGALYTGDEVFLAGTAVEIVPVRTIDGLAVGAGAPGPVTRRLTDRFMELATGLAADEYGWRTPVRRRVASLG